MKKLKICTKKFSVENILICCLCIILTLDCFSLYYKIIGYQVLQILAILVSAILILIACKNRCSINKYSAVMTIFTIIIYMFLFVFGDYKYVGYLTGIVLPNIFFFLILGICRYKDISRKLFKYYRCFVLILCIISLLFFIFGTLLGIIKSNNYYSAKQIGWAMFGYNSYYGMYFEGHKTFILGRTLIRNISIFLEAPIFTYVIINALYFEMFYSEKANNKVIFIFVLTALTTFSTTSIIVVALFTFIYIYKNYMKKSLLKIFLPIGLIIVFRVGITFISDKLSETNMSGVARLDDFMASWRAFFHNPLIGIGFNNVLGINKYRSLPLTGMSCGIPFVFANGGIFHGMLYVLPTIIGGIRFALKKISIEGLGFILTQLFLLTVIVTEYTMLGIMMLVISWYIAITPNEYFKSKLIKISAIRRETK